MWSIKYMQGVEFQQWNEMGWKEKKYTIWMQMHTSAVSLFML